MLLNTHFLSLYRCSIFSQATLSVVNVSALPDKGERLKSQVKELEEALESLSLTTASLSGKTDAIHMRLEYASAIMSMVFIYI